MERCKIAYSDNSNTDIMRDEIFSVIDVNEDGSSPQVVFISADYYNFRWFAKEVAKRYPDATVLGASSYVVFSQDKYSFSGVSAMAIYDGLEISTGIIFDISKNPMKYKNVIEDALGQFDNFRNLICFEFINAFSMGEELVMDTFRSVLGRKSIPIIGCTASVPDDESTSLITLNGHVYSDACAFAFIKNLKGKIHLFAENMYKPTGHTFMTTDVDCDERMIYELDYRPAADVVADCMGVPVSHLSQCITTHPIGRIDGNKMYLADAETVFPDGRISYYSRIYNYTNLMLMEPDIPEHVWERTRQKVNEAMPEYSFSVILNCITRTNLFMEDGIFDDFIQKINDSYCCYFGVCSYGEQLEFEHLNQTMLMAVFE